MLHIEPYVLLKINVHSSLYKIFFYGIMNHEIIYIVMHKKKYIYI
jgi:hypothetical protein